MQLSICIITKNEEEKLKKCLHALKDFPGELIVVDTGSTDGSKGVAEKYTKNVYDFAWIDDFSAAKNFAAQKATYDLILTLDTDEYVQKESDASCEKKCKQKSDCISEIKNCVQKPDCMSNISKKLQEADALSNKEEHANVNFRKDLERNLTAIFEENPHTIGRICRKNVYTEDGEQTEHIEWISRIYDRRLYHYEGKIHEQLMDKKSGQPADPTLLKKIPLTILHDGYAGTEEERCKKALRNKQLLLLELNQHPTDTYLLYQLGKSAYMAKEYDCAVQYFEQALGMDVNEKAEYVIDMVQTYGYALLKTEQYEKALQFEGLQETFGNTADFCFLMGLIYMNNALFEEAIASFEKATTFESASINGANSYKALYNAGVIRECLGQTDAALSYYKRCGSYEKAVQRRKLCENSGV